MGLFIHSLSKQSNFWHAHHICILDAKAIFLAHFEKVEKQFAYKWGSFQMNMSYGMGLLIHSLSK